MEPVRSTLGSDRLAQVNTDRAAQVNCMTTKQTAQVAPGEHISHELDQ